ncbi:MAG TPA: hypothetical protein VHP37_07000 [Burkholderiales bacterium]|nr:hypothetical protein [Burkholderiales bacterium]
MSGRMRQFWSGIAMLLAACAAAAQPDSAAFVLRDFLGREWRDETVRFNLGAAQLKQMEAGRALVGPDGAVPYQRVQAEQGNAAQIEFQANLKPFSTSTYRFGDAPASRRTDLRVEQTADRVRIYNERIGVSVRKRLAPGEGPIEAVKLGARKWLGKSRLAHAPVRYAVDVLAEGPVHAQLRCRVTFADGGVWTLTLRVEANEPVVLVDETFSGANTSFDVVLNEGYAAQRILYRNGKGFPGDANAVGRLATAPTESSGQDPVFMLEPWLHWYERVRQGTWFGLYNDAEPELLAIAARDPAAWIDARKKPEARVPVQLPLTRAGGELRWSLPLREGERRWMFIAADRDASLALLNDKTPRSGNVSMVRAPLPQQYQIKHGDFPLDRVKDYVLAWPDDGRAEGGAVVTAEDLKRWRARCKADAAAVPRLPAEALSHFNLDAFLPNYLCTEDPALGKRLAAALATWMQESVDMFLHQGALITIGFAPHQQVTMLSTVNLFEAMRDSVHVSPDLRQRLRAQLAFLAYTVNREDYWSPERGFAANPNMSTMVAAYLSRFGAALRTHPAAPAWIAKGMAELRTELDTWSDENGGWLEAPHYAMVSYDYMLAAFMAAHNTGVNTYLYDPKMKRVIEWLAKISTPPNAALGGHRHRPPIGNTYVREPSGEFGTIAYLWRGRDPKFASEMQWMYRAQGSFPTPGIGGFFASLAGFRALLLDPAVPESPPGYSSEMFPKTGVILRSGFPSARETQLHMIAGTNHAHYDRDSGSFTLWGKGRVIADDFGYYGYAPGEDHSMVVSPKASDRELMIVNRFAPSPDVDYVRGTKGNAWDRQIVFVKDRDPLGANYCVILDTVSDGPQAMWRAWFTASRIAGREQRFTAEGGDDVDTDIFFLLPPAGSMAIEEKTRTSWGLTQGKYGQATTTQRGLVGTVGARNVVATVLYPRLKTQAQPVFTAIADGNGVKIETPQGTDYVFAGRETFAYRDAAVQFQGTVGAVLTRGGARRPWLGAAGRLAAGGSVLTQ